MSAVVEDGKMNIENTASRSLQEFIFIEVVRRQKAAVVSKVSLGGGRAGGFFPSTEAGHKIIESDDRIE